MAEALLPSQLFLFTGSTSFGEQQPGCVCYRLGNTLSPLLIMTAYMYFSGVPLQVILYICIQANKLNKYNLLEGRHGPLLTYLLTYSLI